MLEARNITLRRGDRSILRNVDACIAPGSVTVILGPNGAGKSTLLSCLAGDLSVQAGDVTLDSRALSLWRKPELAMRRAVLPQKSHLAFPFTVHEVAELGLLAAGSSRDARQRPSRRDVICRSLARVGMADHAARMYHHLSGGEQQRVHIARILCQLDQIIATGATPYLLLDEPVSSLDLRHQLETLDIARDFADSGGGVLAILHDVNLASLYADNVLVMADGRVEASGPPQETLTTEIISRIFDVPVILNRTPRRERPYLLPHTARD